MKKLAIGFILLFISSLYWIKANAATPAIFPQRWETIQISSTATPANLGTPLQVPLTPSGGSNAGLKPCLTALSWSGDAFPSTGVTLSVLDGQTTAYTVTVTTYTSGIYYMAWSDSLPLCLGANTTGYVQISTGNFKVNVYGYRRDF